MPGPSGFGFIPREVKPGDFKDALWTQYLNCVNSLNTLETVSQPMPGMGITQFASAPSIHKFEGNVRILRSMCDGYGLTKDNEDFKKPELKDAFIHFAALTDLLKEKVFAERMANLGTL